MRDGQTSHVLLDGKLHLFRRPRSTRWQASTYLAGREQRISTKTDSLAQAKDVARDWYLTLHGKLSKGEIKNEKTFKEAAAVFEREYEILTEGQRSARYVETQKQRLRVHLIPFFGAMPLSDITTSVVQEKRAQKHKETQWKWEAEQLHDYVLFMANSGGIINLVTKKVTKPTRTGTMTIRLSPDGRSAADLSGTDAPGPLLSISGTADLETALTRPDERTTERFENSVPGQTALAVTGSVDRLRSSLESASGSATYGASTDRTITANVDGYLMQGRSADRTLYVGSDAGNAVTQQYNEDGATTSNASALFGSIQDVRNLAKLDSQFTGDAQFGSVSNINRSEANYTYVTPQQGFVSQTLSSFIDNFSEYLQFDDKKNLSAGANLTAGYSMDASEEATNHGGQLTGDISLVPSQPTFSDRFRFSQIVNAFYVTYERPLGKFDIQPGVRLEETTAIIDDETLEFARTRDYIDIFPSLNLRYQLTDQQQISASYDRRIERPIGDELDPFRIYLSPVSYLGGNPALKPALTNSYEIDYEFDRGPDIYSLSGYFKAEDNDISPIQEALGNGILLNSTGNDGRTEVAGTEVSVTQALSKALTVNLTADVDQKWINSPGVSVPAIRALTEASLKAKVDWNPSVADLLQISLDAYGKELTAQGYTAPYWLFDIGWRHKLTDRWTIEFLTLDPFETSGHMIFVNAPAFKDQSWTQPHVRSFAVTLYLTLGSVASGAKSDFDFNSQIMPPH